MGIFKTVIKYYSHKLTSSVCHALQKSYSGELPGKRLAYSSIIKDFVNEALTYKYRSDDNAMVPSIREKDLLLVRSIPFVPFTDLRQKYRRIFVGDVVVFKDPLNQDTHLVRRVAADRGYEMASSDDKDEPFVLGAEEFWVLSDNKDLEQREAKDSRTFGPISIIDIVGRVIYRMRSAENHGPVENSDESKDFDEAVLEIELDIDEMAEDFKS